MNHGLLKTLFFMAAGYLSGSLLFGRILPKYFKNMDIEEISADHNPGTANVMKYAGIPLGVLCLVLDIGKGYLPILWAEKVVEPVNHLFAGIMVAPVLGHAFPFWKSGHGGKAIAVSFGVLLGVLRYSRSVWLLAALYLFFSLVLVVSPNERRSVYTFGIFGAVSAAFLLLGGLPGVCVGNMLIAAVVIRRNWADARFGQETEEKWEQERTEDV
ncbi:MAG: glycerol-3-phosphate acyltransferase [Lachnospiraceae bacterium]|jgi:glycerol-3-phosphate acyltransferase PlsY|nr:glycerol-3-phosphate acyltransferase [Lachnospiraceae bacterium]